jgi:hypothetical protein
MPSFKKKFSSWQSRTVLQMLLIPIIFFVIFSLLPLTLLYFSSPGTRESLRTKGGIDQTEPIKIGHFALTINSIKISKELIKDSLSITPRKDYTFALINLTFENIGTDVKSCHPQVFLKDEENYVYPEHPVSEIPRPFLFSVYPEEKRTGNYLFQIKKNGYPVELIVSSLDSTTGSPGRTIELSKGLIEHISIFTFK